MKFIFVLLVSFFYYTVSIAQPSLEPKFPDYDFSYIQKSVDRVVVANSKSVSTIQKLFTDKKIKYPCKNIFFRSFKSTNELELWAKNTLQDTFILIKTYKICALSGILGPKRWEGDRQVPEGFYFIDEYNPKSAYHLSLLISYPNYSDSKLGLKEQLGSAIYIHGACMTVGCLPMTDVIIDEIYTIALDARINGQLNVPVHIYPLRYTTKGLDFLGKEYKNEAEKHKFWINIKKSYDYFEATHKLLPIVYDENGDYVF
jgi:murein L,D-transpeptidase YafK